MIKIKVLNSKQIVANERGKFISRLAPYFIDLDRRVEEEIVKQIEKVFAERNIIAEISIVKEDV